MKSYQGTSSSQS